MRLYVINVHHYGGKSECHAVKAYLLANSDAEVYAWLCANGADWDAGYRDDIVEHYLEIVEISPSAQARMLEYNMVLRKDADDCTFLRGTTKQLVMLHAGDYENIADTDHSYGTDYYSWSYMQDVSVHTQCKLLALGIAQRA